MSAPAQSVANVRFVTKDLGALPQGFLYVFAREPGRNVWVAELVTDGEGKFAHLSPKAFQGQDIRVAGASPHEHVSLLARLKNSKCEYWAVFRYRQLSWQKAQELRQNPALAGVSFFPDDALPSVRSVKTVTLDVPPAGELGCASMRVALAGDRKPNEQGVIQVVATPRSKMGFSLGSDFDEELKNVADFNKVFKKHGGFDGFRREYERKGAVKGTRTQARRVLKDYASKHEYETKKEAKKEAKAEKRWSLAGSVSYAWTMGGAASVTPVLEMERGGCGRTHALKVSGARASPAQLADKRPESFDAVTLPPPSDSGEAWHVTPAEYTLLAKDCKGRDKLLKVQVFPPEQHFVSVEFSLSDSPLQKVVAFLQEKVKKAGLDVGLAFSGGFDAFEGWRELEDDWRVYYARELGGKFGAALELSWELSALEIFWRIPTSFTDYAGDVRLTIGSKVGLEVSGSLEARHLHTPRPSENPVQSEGKLSGTIYGGIPVKVDAFLSPAKIIDARATASIEAMVRWKGEARCSSSIWALRGGFQLDKGEFKIQVRTTALKIWEWQKDWSFTAWEQVPPEPKKGETPQQAPVCDVVLMKG